MTNVKYLLKSVFFGSDNRLRAFWRITLSIVLVMGGLILGSVFLMKVNTPDFWIPIYSHLFGVASLLGCIYLLANYIDKRSFSEYGYNFSLAWWNDLLVGALTGIVMMGTAFAISYAFGKINIQAWISSSEGELFLPWLLVVLLGWTLVGIWEESLFRGIFIKNAGEGFADLNLSNSLALFSAWATSTLVFGLLHVPFGTVAEGVSMLNMLIIWLALGGVLGLAYILTGELAFPIGLHATINFATNNLFFGDPKGSSNTPALIRIQPTEFANWTPHADLSVMGPVIIVGCGLILGWVYLRQGDIRFNTDLTVWDT